MNKPFKTIDQQIEILKNRGLEIPNHADARQVLLGTNYYQLINGYKEPFVDKNSGGERYCAGTKLEHIQALYRADEALRSATMPILLRAESVMKTALVHAFCLEYGGGDSYLEENWYRPIGSYQGPRRKYHENKSKLRHTLKSRHDNDWSKDYIQHYLEEQGTVPLWVLAPCLSFGNTAAFFDFQVDRVQGRMCSYVCEVSGKRTIGARKMREVFNVLTPYRNICAHNERFYCAKVGPRGNWAFRDLTTALLTVLTEAEVENYLAIVEDIIDAVPTELGVRRHLSRGLGLDA